ncbi:MAG TPA: hypothetical protein VL093_00915 [Flavipsychrobacter sp.]|nr:hypothetical protein [Flavipsychrobacter sp.]
MACSTSLWFVRTRTNQEHEIVVVREYTNRGEKHPTGIIKGHYYFLYRDIFITFILRTL